MYLHLSSIKCACYLTLKESQMRMTIGCWDVNLALHHQRSLWSNKKVKTHLACFSWKSSQPSQILEHLIISNPYWQNLSDMISFRLLINGSKMRWCRWLKFTQPSNSQKQLTCNFFLLSPYFIQQTGNEKIQTHQVEVFILI